MAETSLYRKYRPQAFSEVVGQDHIVKVLEGQIKAYQPAHAYLFAGTRGTGKTTLARLLAKGLGTSPNDLVEIDAASNTGVDDVRELREAVRTLPFNSDYKVYIIDEVHMLSKAAFNALLKTLEEPPSHVIFVLATTEDNKIPETIISRCEIHNFKKPNEESLKKVLLRIVKKEGWKIDDASASLIAFLGEGSFRDTIGVLQKVMAFSKDKKIDAEEVELITGAPPSVAVRQLIAEILTGRADNSLAIIEKNLNGREPKIFGRLLLRNIRLAMLLKYSPTTLAEIYPDIDKNEKLELQSLADNQNSRFLPLLLKEFLEAMELMHYAYLPELALELATIKITEKISKDEKN